MKKYTLRTACAVLAGSLASSAVPNLMADDILLPELPVPIETDSSAELLFDKASTLIQQQKLAEALPWLHKAAELGHANAAFELASYYELGLGVTRDYTQAKTFYEKAIQQGHSDAYFNLALLFINPKAPFHNLTAARNTMQVLAERGDAEAQFSLALMMDDSLGETPSNPAQALHWTYAAAKNDHPKAQFSLGMHFLRGEQVQRNPKDAFEWLHKAAEHGVASAQFNLGLMYDTGDGIPTDTQQALRWYESAARLGNANAQQNLGVKYLLGEAVTRQPEKALDLITRAAESGLNNAQYLLGQLYQSGYKEIGIDLSQAEQWYLKAAQQGNANAQYQLALLLFEKHNRIADAQFWVRQAVAAGHEKAKQLQAKL